MKKRINLLLICFSIILFFTSCSLFENTRTGSVIFQVNPEQLRSALNARNADFENALIIEVSLEGDYNETQSIKLPYEAEEPGQMNFGKIEPQEIKFGAVPVGSEITAKARIYSYYKMYGDNFEDKHLYFKGTSETITTKDGNNYLTITALDAYKDFSFTINISFAEDSVNPLDEGFSVGDSGTPGTVTVYALKADSPLVKKYYNMFKNRDCGEDDVDDFRYFFNSGGNGDSDAIRDFYSYDLSPTELDSFTSNEDKLVIKGNVYLETDVEYVFVVTGEFNRNTLSPQGDDTNKGIYFMYPNGVSFDKFSSKTITPSDKGNELALTLSKVTPETGYLVYSPKDVNYGGSGASVNTSNIHYCHSDFQVELVGDDSKIAVLDRKSFAFDSHGLSYVYGIDESGNKKCFKLCMYDGEAIIPVNISDAVTIDAITIDSSNDTMYGISIDDNKVYKLNYTSDLAIEDTFNFELDESYREFLNNISFTVFNNTLYLPVKTQESFVLYTAKLSDSTLNLTKKDFGASFELAQNEYVKFTDIIHQGDFLYVLLRAYTQNHDSHVFEARGAIVRINPKNYSTKVIGYNNNMQTRKMWEFNSFANLAGGEHQLLYKGNSKNDGKYLHHFTTTDDYTPILELNTQDNNSMKSYFVGPSKFLAIKPKKLIIADSGLIFYEEEFTDDNGTHKRLASPAINRVIEIDLEQLSLEKANVTWPVPQSAGVYDKFEFEPYMPYADLTSYTSKITEENMAYYDNGSGDDSLAALPSGRDIIPSIGE